MKIIVLDTETTGKNVKGPKLDEIIQLGIIDGERKTIFNEYIRPERHIEWPEAEAKNHISPEKVKNCKTLKEYRDQIIKILEDADLIITYNGLMFDIPIMENNLNYKIHTKHLDIMQYFLKHFALYTFARFSLIEAAKSFNIEYDNENDAHDALNDVKITLKLYNKLVEEKKKPTLDIIYKFDNGKQIYTERLANIYKEKSGANIIDKIYLENGQEIQENQVKSLDSYRKRNLIKSTTIY